MKKNSFYLVIVVLLVAVLAVSVGVLLKDYDDDPVDSPVKISTPFEDPVYSPVKIRTPYDNLSGSYRYFDDDTSEYGIIEGGVNYPSEGIPDDLIICANPVGDVGVEDESELCTTEHEWGMAYGNKDGYELLVPEGIYFMSVERPDYDILGLYTEWVECNKFYDPTFTSYDDERCDSHAQIPIVVVASEMVNGVDLVDYYHY
jgi:hypothetical protein